MVPNIFFVSVFKSKTKYYQDTLALSWKMEAQKDGKKNEDLVTHGKKINKLRYHLDTCKSIRPHSIHPRVTKVAGGRAHWSIFHQLSSSWMEVSKCDPHLQQGTEEGSRTTGLPVWPQCSGRSWNRSPWASSCSTAHKMMPSLGLWKVGPAWLTRSPSVTKCLLGGWGKGCACCLPRLQ